MVSPEQFPDPEFDPPESGEQVVVLAGGCFWCVEAVYKQLEGVSSVKAGYAGGTAATADYATVCSGATDHAEVVEVRFDAARIGSGQILRAFFSIAHDPTQKDRQGPDVGRQYRSAIFYVSEQQRDVAQRYIAQLDRAKVFDDPIVTEVVPLERFYEAEPYHQDYAARNPLNPYILFNARPKAEKAKRLARSLAQR